MARKRIVLMVLAMAASLSAPASAGEDRVERTVASTPHASPLSPEDVVLLLHREGFAEIDRVKVEGGLYVADATRPNGGVFRVRVDPADGRLVELDRVGWSRAPDMRTYGIRAPSL